MYNAVFALQVSLPFFSPLFCLPPSLPPSAERYSSSAWWHNLRTLPTSVILHRIKHPLLAQIFWATTVSLVHAAFGGVHSMSIKVSTSEHTLLQVNFL